VSKVKREKKMTYVLLLTFTATAVGDGHRLALATGGFPNVTRALVRVAVDTAHVLLHADHLRTLSRALDAVRDRVLVHHALLVF
jgi:hypothetical protein